MQDVSPNNPCPFLRALVAAGFVDGHVVPLAKLSKTVEAASGEKGLQKSLAGLKVYLVALIANGLSPLRLLRSFWSGAQLDALRDGPLDKHGSGSRILDATAQVNEAELARLAEFGKDRQDPSGGSERGLTAQEITAYMDAGGTLENAQLMAAHESPRTTKLYDRTGDAITLDEVERIRI